MTGNVSNSNEVVSNKLSLLQAKLCKGVKIISFNAQFGIVALYKPPGVLSHPNLVNMNGVKAEHSARNQAVLVKGKYHSRQERYEIEGNISFWLLHRLDSATSGVILLADSLKVSEEVIYIYIYIYVLCVY
jgi:23S rRNA-/tRNA-specific pseudouridylate synthase